MDLDSALMITSSFGLLMAPFWAKWWSAALKKLGASPQQHLAGVLTLSLATLLAVHVGPWILISANHGTIAANLADPRLPIGMLMVFGPGVIVQIVCAWSFARPGGEMSNRG